MIRRRSNPRRGPSEAPRPATDEQMALLGWQDSLKEEAVTKCP